MWMSPLIKVALGAGVLALVVAYHAALIVYGKHLGKEEVNARWTEHKLEISKEMARLRQLRHDAESALSHKLQEAEDAATKAQLDSLQELDASLAALRGDNLRLRQRFKTCRPDGVSEAAHSARSDDAGGQSGFSTADQETLLRIGAEADQCAIRLMSCQSYVRNLISIYDF